MHLEESFEELPVCNEIRIVDDSHSLGMHGITLADLSIVRIICLPLLISGFSCENTRCLLKGVFDTPEAAACEICNLVPFRC